MNSIRYFLATFVLFAIGLTNLDAQVTGVKYFIQYNMETCNYDACIVVTEGSATSVTDRVQFNAQFTVVVPTGSTLVMDTVYNPIEHNQTYSGTEATKWDFTNIVIAPCAQPENDFYAIVPPLSPASFYNDIAEGDTIRLFGLSISPNTNCGQEIRPFENGVDPNSAACGMNGGDYSNGCTIGGAAQDYCGNVANIPVPDPDVTVDVMCGTDIIIDVTPKDSAMCKVPYMYEWIGPNGFISDDEEDVEILNASPSDYGDYYLTLVDSYGCDTTILITIETPPDIEGDEVICEAGDVSLVALFPTDGEWTLDDSNITGVSISGTSSGEATASFDDTANGDYIFEYTNGGCVVTKTVTFASASEPPMPTADEVCDGDDVQLFANITADAYVWTDNNDDFLSNDEDPILTGVSTSDAGTYTLTVTSGPCQTTGTVEVIVNALPSVNIQDPGFDICEMDEEFQLVGSPADGTWSGTGVDADGNFDPSMLTAGTYTITYEYTDGNMCTNSSTIDLEVNALPTVSIDNTYGPYCIDAADVQLMASPSGGSFSGNGVTVGGVFSPSFGADTHTITYAYTDPTTNCENSTTIDIVVNELPQTEIVGTYGPYCIDDMPVQLMGTPAFGMYSGNGVSPLGVFDPSFGAGTHEVTYTYTDPATDCTNSYSIDIVVNALPTVSIDGTYGPYCIDAADVQLMASPAGGDFSGNGVTIDGVFSPSAGADTHTITYTYTDPTTNCVNSTTIDIVVNELPTVSIDGTYGPYCEDIGDIQILTTPASGGSFAGTGVDPNTGVFDPSIGEGLYTITYNYTDGNGCSASATTDIQVYNNPTLSFDDNYGPYCEDAGIINLSASPGPGTFSGNIDSNGDFDTSIGEGTYTITYEYTDGNGCSNSITTDIVVNGLPTATASTGGAVCIGEDITLFETGGDAVSWSWTNGNGFNSTNQNPVIAGATLSDEGIVTVVVTDSNGCTSSSSVEIEVNDDPIIQLTSNSPICEGETLMLNETGGDAVSWSWTGVNSTDQSPEIQDANPNDSGTYSVEITDSNGCTATASIDVEVYGKPEAEIITNGPVCDGETITFNEVGNDATEWLWSGPGIDGETGQNPTIQFADLSNNATYTVEVTDANGCKSTATIDVVVNELPISTASSNGPLCSEETLVLNETGGDATSWEWTGPGINGTDNNQSPTIVFANNNDAGIYTVVVTDDNGCTSSSEVEVTIYDLPSANATSNGPVCEGSEIILNEDGGDAVSWVWTGPGISGTSEDQSPVIDDAEINDSGFYTVVVTDSNGCESTSSVDVSVTSASQAELQSNGPLCEGETLLLNEISGEAVSWSWIAGPGVIGETTQDVSVQMVNETYTGTYTVEIVDGNGCTSTASIDVVVNPTPEVSIESNGPLCEGETLTLSTTGDDVDSWNWNGVSLTNDDSSSPVITFVNPGDAGTYTVIVTDANGCTNSASIDIEIYSTPTANAGQDFSVCEGDDINLNEIGGDATSWIWSGPNGFGEVDQNNTIPSATSDNAGEYIVQVTDINGCTSTSAVMVSVNSAPSIQVESNGPVCLNEEIILNETSGNGASWTWTGPGITDPNVQSPSIPNADLSNNATYSVIVTDANECTAEGSIDVVVNDTPEVSIESNSGLCEGETLVLNENGGQAVSWLWSGSAVEGSIEQSPTVDFINPGDNGTYSVTITDANGCTSSTSIEVVVTPTPNANAVGPASVCTGSPINLEENGNSGVSWSWTGPNNFDIQNPTIDEASADDAGTYTVVVTDAAGCTSSSSVTVEVLEEAMASISGTAEICEGEQINLMEDGGSAVSWSWTGATTSADQNVIIDDATVANSGIYTVEVTDANGCTSSASFEVIVNPTPDVDAGTYADVCDDNGLVTLVGTPANGQFSGDGVTGNEFDPSIGEGTYDITYDFTDVEGCSNSAMTTIVVNATPTLEILSVDCSLDLTTYTVTYSSTGTVTSDSGTPSGNQVIDIPITSDVIITAAGSSADCTVSIPVSAPECNCDEVPNAVSAGDQEICFNQPTPALEATVDAGFEIDWYDAPVGGTPLHTGSSYSSPEVNPGVYEYYAEARNINDDCTSNTRVLVTLTINELPQITNTDLTEEFCEGTSSMGFEIMADIAGASFEWTAAADNVSGHTVSGTGNIPSENLALVSNDAQGTVTYTVTPKMGDCLGTPVDFTVIVNPIPSITIENVACSVDLLSYTISYTGTATVASDFGTSSGNEIIDIQGGQDVILTITDDATGCSTTLDVTAPDCDCEEVLPPVSTDDAEICVGDVNPTLSVTTEAGVSVNWFMGATPLDQGTNTILTIETEPGIYTYTAIAVNDADGCESATGTDVTFTIHELPSLVIESADCSLDLSTYTITYSSTATVTSNFGTPSGNQITDIAEGQDVILTITDDVTGCTTEMNVTAPNCDCSEVVAPISGDNQEICVGETTPDVEATVDAGFAIDWYTTATGGTSIHTGSSYSSPEVNPGVYEYYAEARNENDNCVSTTRTLVTLTINANPEITNTDLTEEFCEGTSSTGFEIMADIAGTTFEWTAAADNVTGHTASGTGNIPSENLALVSNDAQGSVRYQVTPKIGDCLGTPVDFVVTINPLPSIVLEDVSCSSDLLSYTISYTGSATVTSDFGTPSGNEIIDIQEGQNVVLTLTDAVTGCTDEITIAAINCDCDDVAAPINGMNQEICFGEATPALSATVNNGETIDWYDMPVGGTAVAMGDTDYTPGDVNVGVYTYYAEVRVEMNDCVSSARLPVTLTINALPQITNTITTETICSGDESMGFVLESDMVGTTYTWTSTAVNAVGNTNSGVGNLPTEKITTEDNNNGSVTYTVTPMNNGCAGMPVDFTITVIGAPDAGNDAVLECFRDGEIMLAAQGNGEWSASSTNPENVEIVNPTDANTVVRGFTGTGSYTFVWTVNGCTSEVVITVGDDCPCLIDANNIVDPIEEAYCMTTGELTIIGDDASPAGGTYEWEISINDGPFTGASGNATSRDYDAFNFTGGNYKMRRVYNFSSDIATCSDTSDIVDFYVFDDKLTPEMIEFSPSPVCQGDTLMLMVNYNPMLTYNWTISSGTGRFLETLDSMSMVVVESAGTVSVQVTQSMPGCGDGLESAPTTLDIEINPAPTPQLGNDTTYCELEETFFLNPGIFEEYEWQDGSDDEMFEVEENGIYTVAVKDSLGCVGTDMVNIKSFCCEFAAPNIINITSTVGNNEFNITDIYGCTIESELKVFDRWGNLVYIGPGLDTWDGYYKGEPVAQGVYVYIFSYTALDADRSEFESSISGDVTVLRGE